MKFFKCKYLVFLGLLSFFFFFYNCEQIRAASVGIPKNFKVERSRQTEIDLSWSKVSGASGYNLSMTNLSTGKTYKTTYTKNVNKATRENLMAGYTYKFKLRAYKIVNNKKVYGKYTSYIKATTKKNNNSNTKNSFSSPINLKAKADIYSADLSWSKVKDATYYKITLYKRYIDENNKVTYPLETSKKVGNVTSYKIEDLYPTDVYRFKVSAVKVVNGKEIISTSKAKAFKTLAHIAPPKLTILGKEDISISVKVEGDKSFYKYQVKFYNTVTKKSKIASITPTDEKPSYNLTVTGLEKGVKYQVSVRGVYKNLVNFYSKYSNPTIVVTKGNVVVNNIAAPSGLKAIETGYNYAKLSWNKVNNVDGYILRMINSKTNKTYDRKIKTNSVKRDNMNYPDSDYTFKVKAYKKINGKTYYSNFSNVINVRTKTVEEKPVDLATPANFKASDVGVNYVKLSWSKVDNVDGYVLRMTNSKTNKTYDRKVNTTSVKRDNLNYANTNYTFKIRSFKKVNGNYIYSSFSAPINVKTKSSKSITNSNSSNNSSKSNTSNNSSSSSNASKDSSNKNTNNSTSKSNPKSNNSNNNSKKADDCSKYKNMHKSGIGCVCNDGYVRSSKTDTCVKKPAACKSGYKKDSNGKCVPKCPKNSSYKKGKCVCSKNYVKINGKCVYNSTKYTKPKVTTPKSKYNYYWNTSKVTYVTKTFFCPSSNNKKCSGTNVGTQRTLYKKVSGTFRVKCEKTTQVCTRSR